MSALLRKELRALRPFALLIGALIGMLILCDLATEFPDAQPLDTRAWLENYRFTIVVLILVFGSIVGAGLLINESAQGTLGFLDGLPVSRTRIFFAKIAAGGMVLSIVPLLCLADSVGTGLLSHRSTDAPFPWTFLGIAFLLQCVAICYMLGVAAALSFSRQWFALALGALFWLFQWARAHGISWIGLLDPNELMTPGLDGLQVRIPWRHVIVHLSVALAAFFVAWLGFCALGDRIGRISQHRFVRLIHVCRHLLVPVVWVGAFVTFGSSFNSEEKEKLDPLQDTSFASLKTKRYEFLFRENQRETAQELSRHADAVHDSVTAFLGAEPLATRILVDLASPVMQHTAGVANWTRIRLLLHEVDSIERLKAVLGHETTHVYIEQLSDGVMTQRFVNTRFFHEGLATFVEQKFFGSDVARKALRRSAAAAYAREKLVFETLVDNNALRKARDEALVYPLGEIFCRALVATHGETAPGLLVRAFARPNASPRLTGAALWRDTMQSCKFDFDLVVARYDAELALLAGEEAAFIAGLPMLTASPAVVGDQITIQPQYEGMAPGEIICFVPVDRGFGEEMETLFPDEDGVIRLPRNRHTGQPFRYMLGWTIEGMRWPFFEKWAEKTFHQ